MSAPTVTVVAAIIRREGRLLLGQRPEGVHLAGKWEFPGGKVEPGESLNEALRREVREELGVEVEVGPLYRKCRHQYAEREVHLHLFECRITAGEPRGLDGAALAWYAFEELEALDLPEANRAVIEQLRDEG